jgi:large subunit ribosomal protein L35
MPKMKTHRGTAKRVRVTGSGRLKRNKANHSHILTKKSKKRKRRLRAADFVDKADEKRMKRLLPYGR